MKHLFHSLVLALVLTAPAVAQSPFYYYGLEGQPIEINVIDTLVAVRFGSGSGSAELFALEQAALQDDNDIPFIGNRTFVFRLEPGYSLLSVMSGLRFDEDVTMVNPVGRNRFGDPWWMSNQLLVTYKQEPVAQALDSLEATFSLTRVEVIDDSVRVVVLELNSTTGFDILRIACNYFNTGMCVAVEPLITSLGYPATNDPFYHHQWQLENTGQEGGTADADIDWIESGRFRSANYTKPIVAVIDAGFQLTHEDLAPLANIWPYDAVGRSAFAPVPDADASNDCDGSQGYCWHGTTVLGILKAHTNNALGIAGAEDSARVMPIKFIDEEGNTNMAALARGLRWARDSHAGARAQVVCLTWNFPDQSSPTVDNYMRLLYEGGRPIVVSTGNLGEVDYPANLPYVLAVGMTDRDDVVASNSGAGTSLDVVAPGRDIWTLDLMGDAGISTTANSCDGNANYACNMNGTSFAAPLVAGIIARMFATNPWFLGPQQSPQSAEVVYEILRRSADRAPYGVSGYQRVSDLVGWGRVNANKAVLAVNHGDADNNGQRNVSDAVYLITYIFGGGPAPVPEQLTGDCDCNGIITISDAVYMITWVFGGGPEPEICAF